MPIDAEKATTAAVAIAVGLVQNQSLAQLTNDKATTDAVAKAALAVAKAISAEADKQAEAEAKAAAEAPAA